MDNLPITVDVDNGSITHVETGKIFRYVIQYEDYLLEEFISDLKNMWARLESESDSCFNTHRRTDTIEVLSISCHSQWLNIVIVDCNLVLSFKFKETALVEFMVTVFLTYVPDTVLL